APAGPTRGSYAVGTTFVAPGMHCALATTASGQPPSGPPSNELRATVPGAFHLRCASGSGTLGTDASVVIAPVLVDARDARVVRDRTTLVHVTLASVAAVGERLDIATRGEL